MFECKDEVIYRQKGTPSWEWTYGIFSHYSKRGESVIVNGKELYLKAFDILPYVGNEDLVGTINEPKE